MPHHSTAHLPRNKKNSSVDEKRNSCPFFTRSCLFLLLFVSLDNFFLSLASLRIPIGRPALCPLPARQPSYFISLSRLMGVFRGFLSTSPDQLPSARAVLIT